jgi:hypothetical protein
MAHLDVRSKDVSMHAMKAYGELKVWVQLFLTSALEGVIGQL